MKKYFTFSNRIIFTDALEGFEECICNNHAIYRNIYFDFRDYDTSLREVKKIILQNKDKIDFNYLYFYNAGDFINYILDTEIYLPKNINLFICESCVIGCTYCENRNDIKTYLPLKDIKKFLSQYLIGDNMNFNILGQGDPIFNPELLDILEYIKSLHGKITFFSGGKSLLFCKDLEKLDSFVDEYKINLSCSHEGIYNKVHINPITKQQFGLLTEKFRIIAHKSTFITILMKENFSDITDFIKYVVGLGAYGIEIKKNLHYPKNDIINNPKLRNIIIGIVKKLKISKKINIVSNISDNLTEFFYPHPNIVEIPTILEKHFSEIEKQYSFTIDSIREKQQCFQFGNSLDITENKKTAICCHYDISEVSELGFTGKYYRHEDYIQKKLAYGKKTPQSCKQCPMPVDRYKSYIKKLYTNSL